MGKPSIDVYKHTINVAFSIDFPWIWLRGFAGLGSGDGMDLVWCRFVASKLQRFGAAGLGGWHVFNG